MQTTARPLALITGASSGIGAELAGCAAAAGHDLILVARRADALAALAEQLSSRHGILAQVIACDLSDAAALDRLVAQIESERQRIDVLVNNAGYGSFGEFRDANLADQRQMMRLNMEAPVVLTRRLLPQLLAARGRVLNIASTAAFQPGPYMAVYYATKAFLLSWSEALAEELRHSGVSVTAFCPGPTASGFQDRAAMHASGLLKLQRMPDAASVARAGWQAAKQRRRVVIPGGFNWLLAQSVRFTPRRLVTAMVRWISAPR